MILSFAQRKKLRSVIIAEHVEQSSYDGIVIFSCGNASAELKKKTSKLVIDISPQGDLAPTAKWWTPAEIHRAWPGFFDATSGHLPGFLMAQIAMTIRDLPSIWLEQEISEREIYEVPTGSGETIICLRWAFPKYTFIPVYNINKGSIFDERAPLNKIFEVYEK